MTQIRETIENLCVVLKYNGISEITAETFRLAKFANPDVSKPMWTSLKNMLIWLEMGQVSKHEVHTRQDRNSSDEECQIIVRFCKHEMFTKGYRVRSFFALSENMTSGSRDILLGIGWLMAKENIVSKFINAVKSAITEDVPFKDSYCTGVKMPNFFDGQSTKPTAKNKDEQLLDLIQEVILLKGKLNASCKSLLATKNEYAGILKKIHTATLPFPPNPSSPSRHLSTMDVYLLYHQKEMNSYQEYLELENLYLYSLLMLKEKETLFWKWLESTLDLREKQLQDNGEVENTDSDDLLVFNQEGYRPSKETQAIKTQQVKLSKFLQQQENLYTHVSSKWKRYRDVVEKSNETQDQFHELLTYLDQEVLSEMEHIYDDMESNILSDNKLPSRNLFSSQGVLKLINPSTHQHKKKHKGSDPTEQSLIVKAAKGLEEKDKLLKEELVQMRQEHSDRITKLSLKMEDMVCIPPNLKR